MAQLNTNSPHNLLRNGFSIPESLAIVAAVFVLGAVAFVSTDPASQMERIRDQRRQNDVETILRGLEAAQFDNGGLLPNWLQPDIAIEVGTCETCLDLSTRIDRYIEYIPQDPANGNTKQTGYMVSTMNGTISVSSITAETVDMITTVSTKTSNEPML